MTTCAMPLVCNDAWGSVEIDTIPLMSGAWCAFDLSALLSAPAWRGDNILTEATPGTTARTTYTDETWWSFPIMFSGAEDYQGTAYANHVGGLPQNVLQFRELIIEPLRGTDAVVELLWEIPRYDSPTGVRQFTVDVQPLDLEMEQPPGLGYARGVLNVRVPVPVLVEAYP